MANKKSKKTGTPRTIESQDKRRTRMLQIVFAVFCLMLILSMVLALVSK
jgi:predicted nucleic acid-binding Zn ribbon protein